MNLKKIELMNFLVFDFPSVIKLQDHEKGTKVVVSKISKDQNQIFHTFNLSFLPPKRKDQKRRPIKLQS